MDIRYTIHRAKARFSEMMRHVRQGETVTVLSRGAPMAQIRPMPQATATIEERLDELTQRGVLTGPTGPGRPVGGIQPRPGALERFLAARNE